MHRSAYIVVLGMLALSESAWAGGESWRIKVLRVVSGPDDSAVITIQPDEPLGPWAGCKEANIIAKFEKEPFWRRTWSADVVTAETHREALSRLAEAAKSGATIRFGEMGSGFKSPRDRPCELESRGLAIVEEFGGRKEVYSFYGAI